MSNILEVKNLKTHLYVNNEIVKAVENVSFCIEKGKTFALVGESGSGKSITALSIIRLLPDNALHCENSQINFDNLNLLDLAENKLRYYRGFKISMIFQDPMTCLNPVFTIGEQISEVIKTHFDYKDKDIKPKVISLLKEVRIPDPNRRYNSYPHELSGGMKQRVMIAMALASKPDLLIADEPTTALDVTTQAQILRLLSEIQKDKHMSILLITHDLSVAYQMSDKIAVMKDGNIVETGDTESVFKNPSHIYTQKLLRSVNLEINKNNSNFSHEVLDVKDLRVYFPVKEGFFKKTIGHVKAVDGISFKLNKGETLALLGESGCGKTTAAMGILKLIQPTSGVVSFEMADLNTLSLMKLNKLRASMQIVFQDPYSSMNPRMMIKDIIQEGMIAQGISNSNIELNKRVDHLLESVELDKNFKYRYPHELSGGQRQRVCIARALALNPNLIVCDEPTSALDVSVQASILELLKKLQKEMHISYLFISHDISVVGHLSHNIAVMYLGKIVEYGTNQEVLQNPQHPYTKALLGSVLSTNKKTLNEDNLILGEPPSPLSPPKGCPFRTRCKNAMVSCAKEFPKSTKISETHQVNCYLFC